MTTKMTHAMRMELANAVRDRYATAAHKDKCRILEEFVAATGYHEKSAIRVLNSAPEPKRGHVRQRGGICGVVEVARDQAAAVAIWGGTVSISGGVSSAMTSVCI